MAMIMRSARARLHPAGCQIVDIVVDRGYHPDVIVARAELPLRLILRRDDPDVCSERVVFSSLRLDRRLAPGRMTTIDLPPQPPGEVRFTCALGRYRGRIEFVAGRPPSFFGRLRDTASRLEDPVGLAFILWICSLPLIVLVSVMALDATAALAAAGASFIAWVAGCVWAFGRSARPT
jgi:hypothetical protein